MDVKIKIKNLPQIRAAFNAAPALMANRFRIAMMKATSLVRAQSMLRTPVRTGFLRASHTIGVQGSGLGLTGIIEPTANYAIYVHEGTRYMRARPFLKQAVELAGRDIEGFFTEAVQGALDDIGRRT